MRRQAACRNENYKCFFCDKFAVKLHDHKWIAQFSPCDLVAQEAKYHSHCLVNCIMLQKGWERYKGEPPRSFSWHSIGRTHRLHIEETKLNAKVVAPIIKMTDLLQLCKMKHRILANMPCLNAYKHGQDVMLSFDDDVGHVWVMLVWMMQMIKPFAWPRQHI